MKTLIQLEKLIKAERQARAEANQMRFEYLSETNTSKATKMLQSWDKAMQRVHKLVDEQVFFTLGRPAYTVPVINYVNSNQYLSYFFGSYATN